jgi:hypothetical protein
VFSGDQGSTSYNASLGFKGIDTLKKSTDSASPSPKESPKGSKIETHSSSSSPTPKSGSKLVPSSTPSVSADSTSEQENKSADRPSGLLADIEKPHDLKKTEVVDKSTPAIPAPVKTGDHTDLLKEVEKEGSSHLKHVDVVDKSAPVIESNVHVKKIDRKEILKEVANPPSLRDVDDFKRDRSAPVIDPEVKLKSDARPKILEQITQGPEKPLTKPDAQSDRSAPKIPGTPQSNKCATCGKTVYELEMLRACEKVYHKGCFRCKKCDNVVSLKGICYD